MKKTEKQYTPHRFLDKVGIDFKGLNIPTGTEVFYRIDGWVRKKNGTHLILPFHIESTALLYHIAFGCREKARTVTNPKERKIWKRAQKQYTDMAYRSWRQIWQMINENIPVPCGKSAADAICVLFDKYDFETLVSLKESRKHKQKFDFELSDLPDWNEV